MFISHFTCAHDAMSNIIYFDHGLGTSISVIKHLWLKSVSEECRYRWKRWLVGNEDSWREQQWLSHLMLSALSSSVRDIGNIKLCDNLSLMKGEPQRTMRLTSSFPSTAWWLLKTFHLRRSPCRGQPSLSAGSLVSASENRACQTILEKNSQTQVKYYGNSVCI